MSKERQLVDLNSNDGAVWNPTSTGKKKDGTFKALEATDLSFFEGYYLGTDTTQVQGKDKQIHRFHYDNCGDSKHLSEEVTEDNMKVSVWGSAALDISKLQVGVWTRLTYKGTKVSKSSGNNYIDWGIQFDPSDVMNVGTNPAPQYTQEATAPEPANDVVQPEAPVASTDTPDFLKS